MSDQLRLVCCVLLYGLLISATIFVHAQQSSGSQQFDPQSGPGAPGPARGGPVNPQMELARLTTALRLSEEQQAGILPILQQRHVAIEQLIHSSSDRAATGSQIQNIMLASNQRIRALLSEEQATTFDGLRPPRPPQDGDQQEGRPNEGQSSNGDQRTLQGPPPDGNAPPPQ